MIVAVYFKFSTRVLRFKYNCLLACLQVDC
jgi:hypothetical protein